MVNTRPCALCRHLDSRVTAHSLAYCWSRYTFVQAQGTVEDCEEVERADGKPPPNQIIFAGERG